MTETTNLFKMILTDQWEDRTSRLVGQIAIAFAQLEQVLWLSPKRIKKLPFSVWEATAGRMSVPERCDQIRRAYEIVRMDQKKEAELEFLLKEVSRLNNARNSIFHGRWGCKKNGGEIISRHRLWKGRDRGIDPVWLSQLRDDIRQVRDRLGRFSW